MSARLLVLSLLLALLLAALVLKMRAVSTKPLVLSGMLLPLLLLVSV